MNLNGKTILLTGGRRVGLEVARELGAARANVVLTYREEPGELAVAAEQIARVHGVRAEIVRLDLTEETSVRSVLREAERRVARADVLVNMASVFQKDPAVLSFAGIRQAFDTTEGSMLLSRLFAEAAQQHKARNVPIVSFIDWAVDHPYAGYDLYLAAKAALRHYLMALQTTFAGTIRVVNIHPGMLLDPAGFPAEEKRAIVQNTPTQSIGDPEQAASLVRFALETDFLVDNIFLDGGQHWRHRL